MRLLRLGHKRHVASALLSLGPLAVGETATVLGHSWKYPCGKGLRLPASFSHMGSLLGSGPSSQAFRQLHPADNLTANS